MLLDDAATILAHADFFEICDNEQRRLLAFASEKRLHVSGAIVSKGGEVPGGAHILVTGVLQITYEGGEGRGQDVSEPGTVIGLMALVLNKPRPLTVRALSAAETLYIPRTAFLKLAQQSPDLAQRAADRIRSELTRYLSAIDPMRGRFGEG